MKRCSRCETERPVEEFNRHKGTKDGLNSWCKPCYREYTRTKAYKAKSAEYHLRVGKPRRKNNPEYVVKCKARDVVKTATKRGHIAKARDCPCGACGGAAEQYHHLLGYETEHRLSVIPLCRKCHEAEHVPNLA